VEFHGEEWLCPHVLAIQSAMQMYSGQRQSGYFWQSAAFSLFCFRLRSLESLPATFHDLLLLEKNESIVCCHFIVETEQSKATEGHNICISGKLTNVLTLAVESPRKIL